MITRYKRPLGVKDDIMRSQFEMVISFRELFLVWDEEVDALMKRMTLIDAQIICVR